jgi:PHD/YefM family antitoxin component YafN of YafNO toxin-antitoxin module
MNQLISQEDFTNVQEVQAGTTKLFNKASRANKFYRVMRNKKPLGVMIPNKLWDSLLEDFEALSSPKYLKAISKARQSKTFISAKEAKKHLGIK